MISIIECLTIQPCRNLLNNIESLCMQSYPLNYSRTYPDPVHHPIHWLRHLVHRLTFCKSPQTDYTKIKKKRVVNASLSQQMIGWDNGIWQPVKNAQEHHTANHKSQFSAASSHCKEVGTSGPKKTASVWMLSRMLMQSPLSLPTGIFFRLIFSNAGCKP